MSSSARRKVTLEKSSSDNGDKSKPSVFDRLGPGVTSDVEVCHEFKKHGSCSHGKSCKLSHVTSSKSDKSSEDHHKISRSRHDDNRSDTEKTSTSKSHRDSKDGKIKSTVGAVVSKHSVADGGDGIWPEISSGSRNDEPKRESKSYTSSRQKDSPSKSSGKYDSKLEDENSHKTATKKKKRGDGSVSPDQEALHKRHHKGDTETQSDRLQKEPAKYQSESPKIKDSVPNRLQKIAMESDLKLADSSQSSKKSNRTSHSLTSSATSTSKKPDVLPAKARDSSSSNVKSKEEVVSSKEKSESKSRTQTKESKKGRETSPKSKRVDSKGDKQPSAKGQKQGIKRSRKDSSSSSSSGSSSSSDSSSGSSSSGSSSSSSSSSSNVSLPRQGKKTVKRESSKVGVTGKKKDVHSKRHENTELVDRHRQGSHEAKSEIAVSRSKESAGSKQTDIRKSDDRDGRSRKEESSSTTDATRKRENVRDEERWNTDLLGDSSKKSDRDRSVRDNIDDRRRTNDSSEHLHKASREDDRRRRESPTDRYVSKTLSGRHDRDEQDLDEPRHSEIAVLSSEHVEERQTPRSDREHFTADRYHNEYDREGAEREYESRDRGYDRHAADSVDRNREKDFGAERQRRGEDSRRGDRTSRRGQWENDRETGDYSGRRGVNSRQEPQGHSDKYDNSRDRSRQVRDGTREDVSTRRSSRPDGDRSRDDRDKGRGVVEPDRGHRGTDKDRGEQLDRGGRDQEHVGDQEWDYGRHRDSRDRSKDLKLDSSETSKVAGRSDRYHRDTKRHRSPSTHDIDEQLWDRHRGDKKRSRYEDNDKIRDRGQHRDEGRYSPSRDHSPPRSKLDKLEIVERGDRRGDIKMLSERDRSKDDKRDMLPKDTELSALPAYVTEERSRRSQSRGSLGSRTSQRDPRGEYRFDHHHDFRPGEFRDPLDARGGYRDLERLRERPVANLPPFDREPFPDRDIGYFRGPAGLATGYDRGSRIEVDVTRPPPPIPFRGQDRLLLREPIETRDYDWHSNRGYRGSGRPPNWDRPEVSLREEWDARNVHVADKYAAAPRVTDVPSDHRSLPATFPTVPRDDYRARDSDSLPAPSPVTPRVEPPARPKTDDLSLTPVSDQAVVDTPQAVSEVESDSKANLTEDIGYDDISDDELDDLITGAEDDGEEKQPEKTAVVDILDIKWDSLVQQDRQKSLLGNRGSALKRFSAHSIFSQIGVSVAFAGEALVEKLKRVCQQQIDDGVAEENNAAQHTLEKNEEAGLSKAEEVFMKTEPETAKEQVAEEPDASLNSQKTDSVPLAVKKFELLNPLAEFHASSVRRTKDRLELVSNIGSYRRALCARRDLAVRRALCKVEKEEVVLYPPPEVDHDIYKLSIQLFCQDRGGAVERKMSITGGLLAAVVH